jgi:outer membrane protein
MLRPKLFTSTPCVAAVALLVFAASTAVPQPVRAQPGAAPAVTQPGSPQVAMSLRDAFTLALANNLSYQAALADERTAEARVLQARAGLLPSVSADYSYVHTQSAAAFLIPTPSAGGPPQLKSFQFSANNTNNVGATLQYALYAGGATQAAIGQAAAGLAASVDQAAATYGNVIRDTTNAYFQLVQTSRAADIAAQAVTVAAQNQTTSQELFRAGTAARADVLRQDVTLANARVQAIQARNASELANAALANLLNINLGSVITPTEPLEAQTPSYLLEELLRSSKGRPELAAAQAAVAIADSAVKLARAGSLPAVSLSVQDASSKPNFLNVPQPQLTETLAVTWRLFDGGLTRGKVAEASASIDKAKIDLAQLSNGVDLEVREAYLNYTAAKAQVDAAKTAQASAQENLRVTQIRYRAGVGTALELSDALLSSTQAQGQYVDALTGLRVALVNVQRAAGLPISPYSVPLL